LFSKTWDKLLPWIIEVWFMVFKATFNNISIIYGDQLYWWSKPEYPEKTTDLP
jgi:hypothetical protein